MSCLCLSVCVILNQSTNNEDKSDDEDEDTGVHDADEK